jgi:hypothetical protein
MRAKRLTGQYSVGPARAIASRQRYDAGMRRALAILKYVPAVLCGLLVVAWVVSATMRVGLAYPWPSPFGSLDELLWGQEIGFCEGALFIRIVSESDMRFSLFAYRWPPPGDPGSYGLPPYFACNVPIAFLLTLIFPLAIGSFTQFRFPLWSYFAWTALLAGELAYYVR